MCFFSLGFDAHSVCSWDMHLKSCAAQVVPPKDTGILGGTIRAQGGRRAHPEHACWLVFGCWLLFGSINTLSPSLGQGLLCLIGHPMQQVSLRSLQNAALQSLCRRLPAAIRTPARRTTPNLKRLFHHGPGGKRTLLLQQAASAAQGDPAEPTVGAVCHGFQLLRREYVPEMDADVMLFQHVKTGAKLMSVSTEDENKTFGVTFRTPPADSCGLPHVLEHSVLCGSRKYPVKEPFVELLKGSLQTFLNAFTYPDRTCYPVASCNLQVLYGVVMYRALDELFAMRCALCCLLCFVVQWGRSGRWVGFDVGVQCCGVVWCGVKFIDMGRCRVEWSGVVWSSVMWCGVV